MNVALVTPSLMVGKSRIFEMNAGAFIRGPDAYLVDPGIFADEIDALIRSVGERGAHLRGIILTHSHWDHILGPERIHGVPVIAHESAAAHLAADATEVGRIMSERLAAMGSPREAPFTVPQVDVQFGETLSLPFGKGALRLLHAPGHCADQIVVYETLERTLWAADMLSDLEIPFVEDVKAYARTLERFLPLEITTLVPGHGNHTSTQAEIRERLAWDHNYLVKLESEVRRAVRAGRSIDQARSALGGWPLRRPDINAAEHLRNIDTVYRSLTVS